ncbi:MAG TPA: winged helix-turn-helix domain-containing protein [Candidatus Saccharimonadales bacterium]|nr:winged helix-turn-helix domain-containing protein [Candidatus Saccharimonadales bacterium]
MAGIESSELDMANAERTSLFYVSVVGRAGMVGIDVELMGPDGMIGIPEEIARQTAVRDLGATSADRLILWARPEIVAQNGPQNVPETDVEELLEFYNGRLRMYPAQRKLFIDGQLLRTPALGFNVLELLARNAGRVISKQILKDRVWQNPEISDEAVRIQIGRIRKHTLGDELAEGLVTIPSVGYMLNPGFIPATSGNM